MLQDVFVRVQLQTVVPTCAVWNMTQRRVHIPKFVGVFHAQVFGSFPIEQDQAVVRCFGHEVDATGQTVLLCKNAPLGAKCQQGTGEFS